MNSPVIGFVGMTHLGIVSAAASAAKGFATVCVDPDAELIGRLQGGNLPVSEPELAETLSGSADRLTWSADPAVLARCDLVYVAPDVATDEAGESDLSAIDALFELTLRHAREDAAIVVLSQVPPGYTRRRAPAGRTVFYQVETLIFGDAVARALNPERFIVGAVEAGTELPAAWRRFLDAFGCPVLVMRYESAELAKISINCFLVASVTTTNVLAELCENVGADWSEIAPALRLDRRIGPHAYLTPGLGIAGGNLERDLASVRRMASAHGADTGVVTACLENSAWRKDWVARTLHERLLKNYPTLRIAVLGLAYKENTASTKNAPSIALIARLPRISITVYDPVVRDSVPDNVAVADDAMTAVRGADAVAIMTPWAEFLDLAPAALAGAMAGRLVIDPFRVLDREAALAAGLEYVTLGVQDQEA